MRESVAQLFECLFDISKRVTEALEWQVVRVDFGSPRESPVVTTAWWAACFEEGCFEDACIKKRSDAVALESDCSISLNWTSWILNSLGNALRLTNSVNFHQKFLEFLFEAFHSIVSKFATQTNFRCRSASGNFSVSDHPEGVEPSKWFEVKLLNSKLFNELPATWRQI